MGRGGPFFGGSRKMRGFPMNLSPGGLDESGFPYFASDKFDFGYGAPPFHPHDSPFFTGHPPGMPFNTGGRNNLKIMFDFFSMGSFTYYVPQPISIFTPPSPLYKS